jgi:hypothetical protein
MSRTTRDLIQSQHEPGRAPRATLPIAAMVTANGAARFLGEALASVRAQTASPAEIVVLDDTSPAAERRNWPRRPALSWCGIA